MPVPCPYCDEDAGAAPLEARACPRCGRELVVCERYRIVELLGRGGMGVVYGAVDESGHKVAVKVLTIKSANDWTAWDLFERSSRVLSGLDHPGLPRVYAFARDQPARLILVREALDGGSLAERVKSDQRISPKVLHDLAVSLLEILVYLQSRVPPIIHRDIKPANIMFRSPQSWEPVLADFDTVAAPRSQRTGLTIVGTIGYAAPEQLTGEATPASDVFGLGATLLNVVTHAEPDKLLGSAARDDLAAALDGLDPRLARLLARMVELDPAHRYRDAAAALDALRAPEPSPPRPRAPEPSPPRRRVPEPRAQVAAPDGDAALDQVPRARRWGWYTAVLITAAALATFVALVGSKPPPPPPPPAAPEILAADSPTRQPGTARSHYPLTMRRAATECVGGDGAACFSVGATYETGKGDDIDLGQAARFYGYACGHDHADGCDALGELHKRRQEPGQAYANHEKACRLNSAAGCGHACQDILATKATEDEAALAFDDCKRACKGGFGDGCILLAQQYRDGIGTKRDDFQAAALYSAACARSPSACLALADLVDKGRGVEPSRARAFYLRYDACRDKLPAGCDAVKAAYHSDRARTLRLLQLLCTDGRTFACNQIEQLTTPAE